MSPSRIQDSTSSASSCSGDEMQTDDIEQDALMPIAIIGFSLKFPQEATSAEAFWEMLMDGKNVTTKFPSDRINHEAFRHPDSNRQGTLPLCCAHFIEEDIAAFDAPFFSMTPAEAAAVDPQQRGLLETAYRALENAGIPMEDVLGSNTSVHAGCFTADYASLIYKDPEQMPKYAATGIAGAMVSNRISWFFDLRGPSVTIDTACSSSMVALDQACQGLRARQSKMGLVAGCNLIYSPDMTMALANMGFLSPDGRCYSFDQRANGYARGEGFAVVVIKPLSDAIQDGDTIRAVIRGTGSNQDGRTPGVTQPCKYAQERLIRQVYRDADLDLKTTRYVEAHGTGTPVGDPTEAASIGTAFSHQRSETDPLYIGSVKSNIGHLEAASGLAGLIKTVLVLERGVIPPIAGFQELNAQIDAEFLNLKFPDRSVPWPVSGLRRASVNSFGFGGANSHVILDDAYNYLRLRGLTGKHRTTRCPPHLEDMVQIQDADTPGDSSSDSPFSFTNMASDISTQEVFPTTPKLLVWSAADDGVLKRLGSAYSQHFTEIFVPNEESDVYLDDLAYTLGMRRSHLQWRSFLVAESFAKVRDISSYLSPPVRSTEDLKIGFVFTGQGAQWYAMGRELLAFPVFKKSLLEAEEYLCQLGCRWSIFVELLKDKAESRINEPAFSQPICTALQVALVDLLKTFGITPAAVVGHSSGEIAAAYATGALSCRSAWKVAYYRGVLSQYLSNSEHSQGAMMAVALSESDITPYFDKVSSQCNNFHLYVACINSPKSITISGDPSQIHALKQILDAENIFCRKLQVNVAYHSPYMSEVAAHYSMLLNDLQCGETQCCSCAMVSSVTGQTVVPDELRQGNYWVQNMVSTVRFFEALSKICSNSAQRTRKKLDGSHRRLIVINDLLEIGPHSALHGPVRETLKSLSRSTDISYNSALIRNRSAATTTLEAAGRLHCRGYPVNLASINEPNLKFQQNCLVLTDLPEYPFDHSQRYWHDSRLSNGFRFRKHPHIDLLGTPSSNWNPLEARWRNVIRASEMPWIEDHLVNGSLLYPAAGMVVMAIEAAKQLAEDRAIIGYELKDVTFHSPLKVSTSPAGVETQFYLRPLRDVQDKINAWSEFRVCICEDGNWAETCRGTIQIKYEDNGKDLSSWMKAGEEADRIRLIHQKAHVTCTDTVESECMYQRFQDCGYQYGPTFQPLKNIRYSVAGEATATLKVFQAYAIQQHSIHPTTLDGALQVTFAGLSKGGADDIPTMVPTRIGRLWASNNGLSFSDTDSLEVYANVKQKSYRAIESSISALSTKNDGQYLQIEGLEMTVISSAEPPADLISQARRLCYNIEWRPDIDIMDQQQIMDYCRVSIDGLNDFYQDLAFVLFSFVANTLEELKLREIQPPRSYIQSYFYWMEHQLELFDAGILPHAQPEWGCLLHDSKYQEEQIERIEKVNAQGALYVKVGRSLTKVLSGEMDPLEIFFEDDSVKEFYQDVNERASCYRSLGKYLDCLAHKNPGMKILEIGAGTGATSGLVLSSLTQGFVSSRYAQYDFTDISSSFFEKARETLKCYPRVNYCTLDVEQDPAGQGFEAETYDLIVAANVLHATKDLSIAIQNIRRQLKPGGKLILVEVTRPDLLRVGFAFGLLPGWWLSSEEYRKRSPCVSEEKWNEILKKNGFSGTELIFQDYESDISHAYSIMVTSAIDLAFSPIDLTRILIIADKGSAVQNRIAQGLQAQLAVSGSTSSAVVSLEEAVSNALRSDTYCIALNDIEEPMLRYMDRESFYNLQSLLRSVRGVIWVTGGGGSAPTKADFGGIQGLCRVVREESIKLNFVTVALEDPVRLTGRHLEVIARVSNNTFRSASTEDYEPDYVEIDGLLQVGRVIEAPELNSEASIRTSTQHCQLQKFDSEVPLKMSIGTPGLLDALYFREDSDYRLPLSGNEVEVKVKAIGVNFMDCLVALGRVDSTSIGSECAGIVSRVGPDCSLKVGDRVSVCNLDAYKTYVRAPAECVIKIPFGVSFVEAAAIPTNFVTVFHALHHVAHIQSGESILIHAAAGGTGQAAIQVARCFGAEVYATVGSKEKKRLIMDLYGIPEDHILHSRDLSFAQGIKKMTEGRGVDVILNSLAGEGLVVSWECLANYGRFIEIGKKDIYSHAKLPMFQFSKNATFSAVDVAAMTRERPQLVRKALESAMALIAARKAAVASPLHVFKISEVEKAFRFMQSGRNSGKIVLEVTADDQVQALLDTKPTYYFDSAATYLISGGLGGLGRSLSRWMARRGAKHLVLLSRSGPKRAADWKLVEELRKEGVQVVTPACDVTNIASLEKVVKGCELSMPPFKGCIQASMVLKDAIFDNMSFEEWKSSVKPKIQGSWNLHASLPKGMTFFIMLSSICGIIGSQGQANYAAGNTYQDALARYRVAHGEKATSLDLGIMVSEGFLAENEDIAARLGQRTQLPPIRQEELFALLDHYCDPLLPLPTPLRSQLLTGLEIPANIKAKGGDLPHYLHQPLFRHLHQIDSITPTTTSSSSQTVNYVALFAAAASLTEAGSIASQALMKKLSKILSVPEEEMDADKPMHLYGVDSLIAVELRNWFTKEFSADIAIFEILGGATFKAVGGLAALRGGKSE